MGRETHNRRHDERTEPLPTRVLIVSTSYPRYDGDSASVFIQHLAHSLAGTGQNVHVLAPADPAAPLSETNGAVTIHRFRYFPPCRHMLAYGSGILGNLREHPWLLVQVPFFLIAMFFSMISFSRRTRPNVIHAQWAIPTGFVAVMAGRLLRIPVVTTVHGGDAFAMRSTVFGYLKRFTLNRSNVWTANTQATAEAITGGSPAKAPAIIPMGIDVRHFQSGNRARAREDIATDTFVVLFVGRLAPNKGVSILIESFANLRSRTRIPVQLWIVGDGPEREQLEQLVLDHELTTCVRFPGRIPNDRLPDYYAAADLFVAPSHEGVGGETEGQGVVLLEAMAAGTPIIASRIGGMSEVMEDTISGILVPPRDSAALTAAMADLIKTPDDRARLASNALERVTRLYDWSIVTTQFTDVYADILQSKSS